MPVEIKENGLPKGAGLYWKDSKKKDQIWIVVSHLGQVFRRPSGTAIWKDALKVRDELKASLVKGDKAAVTGKGVRISELLDDYIAELGRKQATRGAYAPRTDRKTGYTINSHVRPYFGKLPASKLTTDHLNKYRDQRIAEYRAANKEEGSWIVSINREFAYLRAAMRLGMRSTPKKVSSYPYFPIDVKGEKLRARTGTVSREQYDLLMEHLSDHMKPVLPFVMYAGVREKELKFIRRVQVDWEKMVIHLRRGETKEGSARDVPIVDIAVEPLRKWMKFTEEFFPECQWLFHYLGRQSEEWRTAWTAACRRAGLQRIRMGADGTPLLDKAGKPRIENIVKFHDTRRTAITTQGRAHVTESDSMRTTGHKTQSVHRAYDQDQDAAVRTRVAINAYLSPPESKPAPPAAAAFAGMTLKELIAAKREGMLTDDEFAAAKATIFSPGS